MKMKIEKYLTRGIGRSDFDVDAAERLFKIFECDDDILKKYRRVQHLSWQNATDEDMETIRRFREKKDYVDLAQMEQDIKNLSDGVLLVQNEYLWEACFNPFDEVLHEQLAMIFFKNVASHCPPDWFKPHLPANMFFAASMLLGAGFRREFALGVAKWVFHGGLKGE